VLLLVLSEICEEFVCTGIHIQ